MNERMHIEANHEPLTGEPWPVPGAQMPSGAPPLKITPTFTDKVSGVPFWLPPGAPVVITAADEVPRQPKPELKIALVGTAPSSRMLAPVNDLSWKIWVCSPGNMNLFSRVDAWFELHKNLHWPEHAAYGPAYIEWLKKQTFPIYTQDHEYLDNSLIFPKDELVAEFGDSFFTSSFAWMMAFALKQGATEIALFGIDMASREEYILQRPGFFFFKHIAELRGVKVSAPHESDIMQPPGLYGYSDVTPFGRKVHAREQELKERIAQLDPQINALTQQKIYLQGALEDCQYTKQIWLGLGDK